MGMQSHNKEEIVKRINASHTEHKLTADQIETVAYAKHSFAWPLMLPRMIFGPILTIFALIFLSSITLKELELWGSLLIGIFLLLGITSILSIIRAIFRKSIVVIAKDCLYVLEGKSIKAWEFSTLIKDLTLRSGSIRVKQREDIYLNDLYITGVDDVEQLFLNLWQKILASPSIANNLTSFLATKKELFQIKSIHSYPVTNYIFIMIIGIFWTLGSSLFLYAGVSEFIDHPTTFTLTEIMITLYGLVMAFLGMFIGYYFGLRELLVSDSIFIGTEDELVQTSRSVARLLAWNEVKFVSAVKKRRGQYELWITGSLEHEHRSGIGEDTIYIVSRDDLSKVREIVQGKIN